MQPAEEEEAKSTEASARPSEAAQAESALASEEAVAKPVVPAAHKKKMKPKAEPISEDVQSVAVPATPVSSSVLPPIEPIIPPAPLKPEHNASMALPPAAGASQAKVSGVTATPKSPATDVNVAANMPPLPPLPSSMPTPPPALPVIPSASSHVSLPAGVPPSAISANVSAASPVETPVKEAAKKAPVADKGFFSSMTDKFATLIGDKPAPVTKPVTKVEPSSVGNPSGTVRTPPQVTPPITSSPANLPALPPLPVRASTPAALPPLPSSIPELPPVTALQGGTASAARADNKPSLPPLTPLTGDAGAVAQPERDKVFPPAALPSLDKLASPEEAAGKSALPPLASLPVDIAPPAPVKAVTKEKESPKELQKESKNETQMASLPLPGEEAVPAKGLPAVGAAGATAGAPDLRVTFKASETDVPLSMMPQLDALAQQLTVMRRNV